MRVKIKRLEQQCKGKERAQPSKRKKVLDPGPGQQRIHKFFSKVSKAEAGSSRANSNDNQGATCGPLEGVSGQRAAAQYLGGTHTPNLRFLEGLGRIRVRKGPPQPWKDGWL